MKANHKIESAAAPVEVDGVEGYATGMEARDMYAEATLLRTLARQLAEANDTARSYIQGAKLDALTRADMQKESRLLQSQLAEATRRLGEVEGVLNAALRLQEKHYGDGMNTHLALLDWARDARAALTKEPTK